MPLPLTLHQALLLLAMASPLATLHFASVRSISLPYTLPAPELIRLTLQSRNELFH